MDNDKAVQKTSANTATPAVSRHKSPTHKSRRVWCMPAENADITDPHAPLVGRWQVVKLAAFNDPWSQFLCRLFVKDA